MLTDNGKEFVSQAGFAKKQMRKARIH